MFEPEKAIFGSEYKKLLYLQITDMINIPNVIKMFKSLPSIKCLELERVDPQFVNNLLAISKERWKSLNKIILKEIDLISNDSLSSFQDATEVIVYNCRGLYDVFAKPSIKPPKIFKKPRIS